MRARLWAILAMSALVTAGCGADHGDHPDPHPAAAATHDEADHGSGAGADADLGKLPDQLAATRLATANYVTDLTMAQADGYQVITPMMPDMGVHYLNPGITDFDPGQPPILVYVPTAAGPQLGAVEWVFPEEPEEPSRSGTVG